MINLNKVNKTLKSFLKGKVSITKQVTILFLMMGGFAFSEFSHFTLPGNYSLSSSDTSNAFNNGANGNIAIGEGNNVRTDKSIIVGDNNLTWTKEDGSRPKNILILGNNINGINSDLSIIVGNSAGQAGGGKYNLTFGNSAGDSRYGSYTVSYGDLSGFRSNGEYNFGFGWKSGRDVTGNYNFAFGSEAGHEVTGSNNIAFMNGAGARTAGSYNMAIGFQTGQGTKGDYNFSFGPQAGKETIGNENVAIGSHAGKNVSGNTNYALGRSAGQNVSGLGNIAFGENAGQNVKGLKTDTQNNEIQGNSNVAIGKEAGQNVISNQSLALGHQTGSYVGYRKWDKVAKDFTAATTEYSRDSEIGNPDLRTGAEHNTAIGSRSGNYIAGQDNVAIGEGSGNNIDGPNQGGAGNVGIGSKSGNNIFGDNNIAVGRSSANKIIGSNNIAIGTGSSNTEASSYAEKENTISIGTQADATQADAIAIGHGAKAKKLKTVALGENAITDVENSVSLGNDTDTEGTANTRTKGTDNTYTTETISDKLSLNFAGGDQVVGVVSVGNSNQTRRIQNVAPGLISSTSTDAINGSQLYALAEKVANIEITAGGAAPVLSFTGDNLKTTADAIGKVDLGRQKLAINGTEGKIKTEVAKDGQSVTISLDDAITNTIAEKADKSEIKTYVVENGKNTVVTKDESTSGTVKFTVDAEKTVVVAGTGLKMVSEVAATKANNYVNTYTLGLADEVVNKLDGKADKSDIAKTTLTITDGKVADLEDANKTKLVTADTVRNAINNTGFFINSGKTEGENTGANKTLVKAGEEVKLIAGKNVTIAQSGKEFTFSVDLPEISKTEVKAEENSAITVTKKDQNKDIYTVGIKIDNDTIKIQDGKLKAIIPSIEAGTITDEIVEGNKLAKTDEPNKYTTTVTVVNAINTLGNNTISLSGNTGNTDSQNLNKENGITFGIKGKGLVKTEANGNEILIDLTDETKEKINNIEKGSKSVSIAANAGVSSAVAMANLPQVSNIAGHRHNIAGAYGYYNGEHAFALGLSGLNETGNLVYKASGSLNTKGHVALGAGLGYQFDKLESRRKDMLTLQRNGNINLLDEKVYELDKEIISLKAKVEKMENFNQNIKQENLKLNQKLEELEKIIKKLTK